MPTMNRLPLSRLAWPAALALTTLLSACSKPAEAPAATTSATAPATAAVTPPSEPAPAPAATQDVYTLAATGSGFHTGPMMSAHTVYVFFDTTCPHCAHLWQAAQGLGSQLKIVWMPVGLLRPQSLPQGVTILAAPDPAAAMAQNEASVANHGNGITAMGTLDAAVAAKVKANTELFNAIGTGEVPLIVYRNAKTGEVGKHAGAVDGAELLKLAGLP
ncbi:MAG: thioredoxin fold domain-containing protein [Burkholderiaceae bacterium]